jgi:CubicO group peptidase (beta-lactamase class C family)
MIITHSLHWDTPVKQYLGEDFALYDETLTEQVTLRDLLAHRTGIQSQLIPSVLGYPEGTTRDKLYAYVGQFLI